MGRKYYPEAEVNGPYYKYGAESEDRELLSIRTMWKPLWIVGDKINPIRNRSER
jgi:hypothetical protein